MLSISKQQLNKMELSMLKNLAREIVIEKYADNSGLSEKWMKITYGVLLKAHNYGITATCDLKLFFELCSSRIQADSPEWVPSAELHNELSFPNRDVELKLDILRAYFLPV
jgi:hypothetical protein